MKSAMYTIGDNTEELAKRVGSGTARVAKRVGPTRAIIGVAVIGAVVGGTILLVRYLRARREELPIEGQGEERPERADQRRSKRGVDTRYSH